MKKISIYGHSGSYNHGNEAVVRGLCNILRLPYKPDLYCADTYIDRIFELDDVCELLNEGVQYTTTATRIKNAIIMRATNSDRVRFSIKYKNLLENVNGIYLFTAEDQYCEPRRVIEWFEYQNKEINRRGGRTIAVGCTINENLIGKSVLLEDLCRYSLVIARESITYDALLKNGINAILAPCTAFKLPVQKCQLSSLFDGEVIGLNLGPLSQGNERFIPLYYENCKKLLQYILKETNLNIALIPHMNWYGKYSDIRSHIDIVNDLNLRDNKRVELIKEHNASIQKYIISQCKMIITVRTHVSIPAYASCVPTLVTGYKQKSIGIAKDIFGTSDNYVKSIQDLTSEKDFVNGFKWLYDNEAKIRKDLNSKIPNYIGRTEQIKTEIFRLADQ